MVDDTALLMFEVQFSNFIPDTIGTYKHSFMYRPVHLSLGRVKTNMDGQKYGWTGKTGKK